MKLDECWMPDAQQSAFRAVLDGFARPGARVVLGTPAASACMTFLAMLLDESVTLADTTATLNADVRRLLLAPDAMPDEARFVLLDGRAAPPPDFQPALGTLAAPELGATLVLTIDALGPEAAASTAPAPTAHTLTLSGPGIDGACMLHVAGLHPAWLTRRAGWTSAYPLGIDLVLCAPDALAAIPRTTRINIQGV